MKSLEVGYWVDEEPYELSDAFPAAQVINFCFSFFCLLCFFFSITEKPEGLSLPVCPPPSPPSPRTSFSILYLIVIVVSIIVYFFISFYLTSFHFCGNEAIFYRVE